VSQEPTWTLYRFQRAGRSHLSAAKHLLEALERNDASDLNPSSAAYLAHVGLECALKARLLWRGGVESAEDLEEKHPQVHAALFRGRQGHNLGALAKELRLQRLLATEGKPWKDDSCWKRISHSDRPYALRYGTESMERDVAKEELDRIAEIAGALMAGLRLVPLRGKKGRG
jgi:hypothetical protein